MGSLENLPVELFLMIIDQIQRRDLIALRATSRMFSFLTFLPPYLLGRKHGIFAKNLGELLRCADL